MSFNRMKIGTKLVLFPMVIVLIGVAALGVTISNTIKISNSAKEIAAETEEASRLADFETTLAEMKIAERDFLLPGDPAFLEIREEHEHHAIEKLNDATEAQATGSHEHHALEGLREQLEADESFHHVVEIYQSGNQEEALRLYNSSNGVASHDEHGDESGLEVDAVISEVLSGNDQQLESTILMSVIAAVVAVAFALIAGLMLSRKITKPILKLRDIADKVSLGDLDFENTVNAQDEIGELSNSFDRMVTAVRFLVADGEEDKEQLTHAVV
ncbi:MAG: HAMP domain-containing protein [Chloroflexi bacterium]|nr:HAMP domain-containing protein [Chloroflexota bacterium]